MREDMIGCEVVDRATEKPLGHLAAWGTWDCGDGIEPCAVVVDAQGVPTMRSLNKIRLVAPSLTKTHSMSIQAQIERLRSERDSLAEQLQILEDEHEAFMQEGDEACRLVGKGEDETLPQAILRALAEARKEARRA